MPYKLPLFAKIVLVFSLLIGLASVFFGQQWQRQTAAARTSLAAAKKDVAQATAALAAVNASLSKGTPATALETLLPSVMLDVFNQRTAHGIALTTVTPAKSGGAQMNVVRTMVEPVKGSAIGSFSIHLTGTYKTYPGLLDYLAKLQVHPLAVSRLKVQDQTFDVTLRLFGTFNDK